MQRLAVELHGHISQFFVYSSISEQRTMRLQCGPLSTCTMCFPVEVVNSLSGCGNRTRTTKAKNVDSFNSIKRDILLGRAIFRTNLRDIFFFHENMLSGNERSFDRRYVAVDISILLFACGKNIRDPLCGIHPENTSAEHVIAAVERI